MKWISSNTLTQHPVRSLIRVLPTGRTPLVINRLGNTHNANQPVEYEVYVTVYQSVPSAPPVRTFFWTTYTFDD